MFSPPTCGLDMLREIYSVVVSISIYTLTTVFLVYLRLPTTRAHLLGCMGAGLVLWLSAAPKPRWYQGLAVLLGSLVVQAGLVAATGPAPSALVLLSSLTLGVVCVKAGLALLDDQALGGTKDGPLVAMIAWLFLVRLVFAASISLLPQEALHWCRAQHLSWAYVDHPGGVAWLIWASSALLGDNELAVRIGAILMAAIASLAIYRTTFRLLSGAGVSAAGDREGTWRNARHQALLAVLLFNSLPFFFGAGWFAFPDAILIAAFALAVDFGLSALVTDKAVAWIAFGLAVGLGLCGKYTMGSLILSLGLFLVVSDRRRLLTRGPWLAALAAALVFAPVVLHEATHDWATIRFQFLSRAHAKSWNLPLFVGMLFGEVGLALPFLLAALVFALKRWKQRPLGERWLAMCGLIPLAAFGLYSNVAKVKLSWPAIAFIPLLPLLVTTAPTFLRERWLHALRRVAPAFASTLLILTSLTLGLWSDTLPLPFQLPAINPRQPADWSQVAPRVAELCQEIPGPVFLVGNDEYNTAALLSFYVPALQVTSRNVFGQDGLVWNGWTDADALVGMTAIVFEDDGHYRLGDERIGRFFRNLAPVETLFVGTRNFRQILRYRIGTDYQPTPTIASAVSASSE